MSKFIILFIGLSAFIPAILSQCNIQTSQNSGNWNGTYSSGDAYNQSSYNWASTSNYSAIAIASASVYTATTTNQLGNPAFTGFKNYNLNSSLQSYFLSLYETTFWRMANNLYSLNSPPSPANASFYWTDIAAQFYYANLNQIAGFSCSFNTTLTNLGLAYRDPTPWSNGTANMLTYTGNWSIAVPLNSSTTQNLNTSSNYTQKGNQWNWYQNTSNSATNKNDTFQNATYWFVDYFMQSQYQCTQGTVNQNMCCDFFWLQYWGNDFYLSAFKPSAATYNVANPTWSPQDQSWNNPTNLAQTAARGGFSNFTAQSMLTDMGNFYTNSQTSNTQCATGNNGFVNGNN